MTNSADRPLITIAIPTYNRAELFLQDAIHAALQQTYFNIEIIISDNCSTDNTESVVKLFPDPRIRYFRQKENIGANNNFNFCLQQAKGDYFLLFLDDDQIDPDFLETCMNAVKGGKEVGIIRTGTRMINEAGEVKFERPNPSAGLSFTELLRAWFRNKTTFYLCSTLINTRVLREIGGFHSRHNLFQDVGAELKAAARLGRIDIEEVKAGFRLHDGNMGSAARIQDWCEDSLELLDIMCALVGDDKEIIRTEGKRFFCRMNYCRSRSISSPVSRMKSYFLVAKKFDHVEPLFPFILQKDIRPFFRSVKKKIISGGKVNS